MTVGWPGGDRWGHEATARYQDGGGAAGRGGGEQQPTCWAGAGRTAPPEDSSGLAGGHFLLLSPRPPKMTFDSHGCGGLPGLPPELW